MKEIYCNASWMVIYTSKFFFLINHVLIPTHQATQATI
jgi:hypothetical protein